LSDARLLPFAATGSTADASSPWNRIAKNARCASMWPRPPARVRGGGRRERVVQPGEERGVTRGEQRRQQRRAIGEIVVNRAHCDARARGDGLHLRAREPLGRQHLLGRVENRLGRRLPESIAQSGRIRLTM
jgi:hypothetical protein